MQGLMLGLALSSIAIGIFDFKHYMHLQLVPHISKYYQVSLQLLRTIARTEAQNVDFSTQYWRLFSHHLACANSSDLLLAELLLYNVAVRIERTFGSVKFAVSLGKIVSPRVGHSYPMSSHS